MGSDGDVRALQTAREEASGERSLISNEHWGEGREQGQAGAKTFTGLRLQSTASLNSGYIEGLYPC